MQNKNASQIAETGELSYDDIQALVREGRRQRAIAVRLTLETAFGRSKGLIQSVKEKIQSAGARHGGRTA